MRHSRCLIKRLNEKQEANLLRKMTQQHDTRSCGVFIMKYMENIVQDKCYQMDFTADDMKDIISEIA
ncbi:hypothetical protein LWI29_010631 [Acer saccharum]|uniref:Ubiquitin-like protease family profile domain-containing protein n=1 Tax=Acer saccharum TaxID=4024 RepID=A0AA39VRG9_ACESA|nr:hypothetical protein LWI29_010631 [Acer saccharum]